MNYSLKEMPFEFVSVLRSKIQTKIYGLKETNSPANATRLQGPFIQF